LGVSVKRYKIHDSHNPNKVKSKLWHSCHPFTGPGPHLGQAACFLGSRGMQLLEWRKHKLLGMLMKEEQLLHHL
jgi:hypothetical protein